MKKHWILLVLLALLLTGCGQTEDRHPDWDAGWARFGDLLAAETPADFSPGEYNDALSLGGIWYASFNAGGGAETIVNAEGEDAEVYDAELFLLVQECADEGQAQATVKDWIARERENYRSTEPTEYRAEKQSWQLMELTEANTDNPYSRGLAAFAVRGSLAISAELICRDTYTGDATAVVQAFLNGIHYGE